MNSHDDLAHRECKVVAMDEHAVLGVSVLLFPNLLTIFVQVVYCLLDLPLRNWKCQVRVVQIDGARVKLLDSVGICFQSMNCVQPQHLPSSER